MPSLSSYTRGPDPLLYAADCYSPLIDIIAANDVEALEEYIEKHELHGERISGGNGDMYEEAIRYGSVDVYYRLVAYQKVQAAAGSDRLPPPYMPLHEACRASQLEMVRSMLSNSDDIKADISTPDHNGRTPLLSACQPLGHSPMEGPGRDPATAHRRSEEIVGILLDHGASVQDRACEFYKQLKRENGQEELCDTPLSLAMHYIGPALLRRFIDLGAPLHAPLVLEVGPQSKFYEDVTLMHIAATFVNCDAIEILLGTSEGRDMIQMRDKLGRLPIHWAANCGTHDTQMRPDEETTCRAVETIKLLLPHSPVNDTDALGNTPLHLATTFGFRHGWIQTGEDQEGHPPSFRNAVIHLLLDNGADVTLRNHKGDTALGLIIATRGNPAPTRLISNLLAHGAALNEAADAKGNTPLHFAAQKLPQGFGIVKFLLERGADPTLANADGDTAAHMAPRSQAKNLINDVTPEIEQVLDLFEKASGDAQLRDMVNNAGVTPRGVLKEEQAGLAQRMESDEEAERRFTRGRGAYRGSGRGRGRGF
ncbi:ankyrin repeat-containing domain protein [Apiospora arundinis]|uniref:Ankyrin repeat-containing domain protein n=1 Tax=Apiospora arundinis TaxID=335852 RepID=A0ABR2I9Z1_9PEZI